MQQYLRFKAKYPDAILLFRVGDFYETFGEDAVTTSGVLGIVLTSRNNGGSDIELAGFPYHSLDLYLPKLVKAGYRVAICEQLEKPDKLKKIVKRGVTEIVTPGIVTDDKLLNVKDNNYLASVHFQGRDQMGVSFLDLSTGEFLVSEGDLQHGEKLFHTLCPSEIIFARGKKNLLEKKFGNNFYCYPLEDWVYTLDYGREKLINHFQLNSLKGFGIEDIEAGQIAAGAILHYLDITENDQIPHIQVIQRIAPENYVWLDKFSIRNLELIDSNQPTGVAMIDILDKTVTPMGGRLLKKWLLMPLKSKTGIDERLNVVSYFLTHAERADSLYGLLKKIGDLERLISKVSMEKVNPREMQQLATTLKLIPDIKKLLQDKGEILLQRIAENLQPCKLLIETIDKYLVDSPPVNLQKGAVIREKVSEELDQLRHLIRNNKDILIDIQQREAVRTGIQNLKIGYNSVFGYYLEVTNKYKNQGLIPSDWIRKQTLSGSERYVTQDLKELEDKILHAEEKIQQMESELFNKLIHFAHDYIEPVQHNALLVAKLDCLSSFAELAKRNNYCKPSINESLMIDIKKGRHPVIEKQLNADQAYVPNDVVLHNDECQIMMITGPNMSGKSALLRQTALICLMAQMGSFVPAEKAELGIIDKVFTRVGASDNISSGESTFMVEMNETASIMNNLTERSLILLDEIGRGTSTYDGISIAWSIAEFLHENSEARPKTLFATHYHELNLLADNLPRIRNYHISTKEIGKKVLFLRTLLPGGSQHSFGIHVAHMAGMPRKIVERADAIMKQLEQKHLSNGKNEDRLASIEWKQPDAHLQLSIFETVDKTAGMLKDQILDLDLNTLTPIECMLKLNEIKKWLEEQEDQQ